MNTNEIVQPNLFPFPFPMHLIFACVALFFFVILYIRHKKPYQFIFAFAIPFSLSIWLSNNRNFFRFVGTVELILIILAIVSSIVWNHKHKNDAEAAVPDGVSADSESNGSFAESAADKIADEAAETASNDIDSLINELNDDTNTQNEE